MFFHILFPPSWYGMGMRGEAIAYPEMLFPLLLLLFPTDVILEMAKARP